ncbi:MAG: hypothetical protein M3173_00310 [Chloroflexota bacterium]|nr:hypothetical protein [Chloroflexota bacterium]
MIERLTDLSDEGEIVNLMDRFILEHKQPDGRTIIDHFVDAHPELPDDEREMLLGWHDVVEGIFRIEQYSGDGLVAINLIDGLTYEVYSNIGKVGLRGISPGMFLFARLLLVLDVWILSGVSQMFPASSRAEVYRAAQEFVTRRPELAYRNPEILEKAWEFQRRDREDFIQCFGTDELIVAGHEVPDTYAKYMHYKMYESHDDEGKTLADRSLETSGSYPDLLAPDWEPHLLDAETVGIIYDETEGLTFLVDYGAFQEAFTNPDLVSTSRYRKQIRTYLRDSSISPVPFRRQAERDPDRASRLFRAFLGKPGFDWERDGESFLRRHKADHMDRTPLPTVTPINEVLSEGLNATTPGSRKGRKWKR